MATVRAGIKKIQNEIDSLKKNQILAKYFGKFLMTLHIGVTKFMDDNDISVTKFMDDNDISVTKFLQ